MSGVFIIFCFFSKVNYGVFHHNSVATLVLALLVFFTRCGVFLFCLGFLLKIWVYDSGQILEMCVALL